MKLRQLFCVTAAVLAANDDNTEPALASFTLVVYDPIWVWNYGRDNGIAGTTLNGNTNNTTLTGRGRHTAPVKVRGWGTGGKIANSNDPGGIVIDSAGDANTNRIAIGLGGSNDAAFNSTTELCPSGDFDFLGDNKNVRVTVGYQVLTPSPGRNMYVLVNNNTAAPASSPLKIASKRQLIDQTVPDQTSRTLTASGVINVRGISEANGKNTLGHAFLCIMAQSNGPKILITDIRIDYADTIADEGEE
jgi:hypothetical protein